MSGIHGHIDVSWLATARQRRIKEILDTLPDQTVRTELVDLLMAETVDAVRAVSTSIGLDGVDEAMLTLGKLP